jgi:phosphopantothenoylcysteine decarboxylase/phosphopantothenate--cysteine ligase
MFKETQKNLPVDVAIFSAAVADFKVHEKSNLKIKKSDELTIKLEKNVDILNYISNHNSMRPKLVVGFAAETNDLEKNAIQKLKNKNCDIIIGNDVSNKKIGFDSNLNEVTIFYKNNKQEKLFAKSKTLISEEIVERINNQLN